MQRRLGAEAGGRQLQQDLAGGLQVGDLGRDGARMIGPEHAGPAVEDPLEHRRRLGRLRISTLVKQIRKTSNRSLWLDSGDAFQGAPVFNEFKGEVEMRACDHQMLLMEILRRVNLVIAPSKANAVLIEEMLIN